MKTPTTYNPEVTFADSLFAGYGHQKITVKMEYKGEYKTFYSTTNCMKSFDEAQELEGQEKYEALYDIIENDITMEVIEWCDLVNQNETE